HEDDDVQSAAENDPVIYVKTVYPAAARTACQGHELTFPPGHSPHTSYAFALYARASLPWDYETHKGILRIRARACTCQVDMHRSCGSCRALRANTTLKKIMERISNGVHENTSLEYHGIAGLVAIACQKTKTIDMLNVQHLSDARKLVSRDGALDGYKQMLLALSSQRIPRIDRVLHVAFR
ncbi:hypothetical protein OF83DRAFT_1038437, partial [Amylostereum chailletii]